MNEQDLTQLKSYQAGSRANRIAKRGAVKRLVMSVTYGLRCGESLAKLSQDGSWLKMYGDYFQARMDGSLEEYSGTFPTWGMMLDGVAYGRLTLGQSTTEKGLELLPTPVASDAWIAGLKSTEWDGKNKHSMTLIQALNRGGGDAIHLNPNFCEMLMGFPVGWTESNV